MVEAYRWNSVPIGPFGFVTGIVIKTTQPYQRYVRTDVGGAYRYNESTRRWDPFANNLSKGRPLASPGIESLAVDESNPAVVYVAAEGDVFKTSNGGKTWTAGNLKVYTGPNDKFRGNGERLLVDPNNPDIVYFGTRKDGLFRSFDAGKTWLQVPSVPKGVTDQVKGSGLSFVLFDPKSGQHGKGSSIIYLGIQGAGVYQSRNAGKSFVKLAGGPPVGPADYLPFRAALGDDGTLFVTFSKLDSKDPEPDNPKHGAVWRYDGGRRGARGTFKDVSPHKHAFNAIAAVGREVTVGEWKFWPSCQMYTSKDAGDRWEKITPDEAYAKYTIQHWKPNTASNGYSSFAFDPADRKQMWKTDGWGVWRTLDRSARPITWSTDSEGIEELCYMSVVKVPGGPLLSGVMDMVGFAHWDLGQRPPIKFDPAEQGWGPSMDFCEQNPKFLARTGVVVWPHFSKNFGSASRDGGRTWTYFGKVGQPEGAVSGIVAVSASADPNGTPSSIVWAPIMKPVYYSIDGGKSWHPSTGPKDLHQPLVYNEWWASKNLLSDRVDGRLFYAYGKNSDFYRSEDGGRTFVRVNDGALPRFWQFGMEAQPDERGHIWAAFHKTADKPTPDEDGLYRSADGGSTWMKLAPFRWASEIGFGRAAPGKTKVSVYVVGDVSGKVGIYRSDEISSMTGDGRDATWVRITDDDVSIGHPAADGLVGDRDVFGRVYVGSQCRGLFYGHLKGQRAKRSSNLYSLF